MGALRMVLPGARWAARVGGRPGDALLGSALLRCVAPRWVWWRDPAAARQLAWAGEAVVAYRRLPRRPSGLARALALYANALCESGRYEEAITAAEESLAVAGARRSPTQTGYTLHVRSTALAGTGRLDEALVAVAESVAAYRDAVPRRADRSMGHTVNALRAYGWTLDRLGRAADSVAAYQECAGLLRDMPARQSLSHARLEIVVLAELATALRDLDRFDEAIEVATRAREQTDARVLRFYPELLPQRVQILLDLAWCHGATGGLPTARDTAEEAVAVARTLVGHDRPSGERALVLALECLSHHLGELDLAAEELSALEELAELCARLAADNPDRYEPQLAAALDDLAYRYEEDGALRKAVEATTESADVYRRAAGRDPRRYEPELARVLANLSLRLRAAGSPDAAVAGGREALAITRRLAGTDPDTYRPLTAARLRILADALRPAGQDAEAAACYDEAGTIDAEAAPDAEPEREREREREPEP
ncbi:tetratricopeptide repeat protein [Streptomyces sp. NPDC093109]|uniref:tetratricopeptide repeat protein n=1 Tax=Streptomyces sp. NPDC093109 TaxID=3154977 RepID=UPI00344D6621